MRVLGLDYGSKTCGVAISDESMLLSTPKETIFYKTMDELLTKLDTYFTTYNISIIALGNPINLDGSISDRSKLTLEFKSILEQRYNIKVELIDERLTTVIINNMFKNNNVKQSKRKKVVDSLAASLILESYINRRNNERQWNNIYRKW